MDVRGFSKQGWGGERLREMEPEGGVEPGPPGKAQVSSSFSRTGGRHSCDLGVLGREPVSTRGGHEPTRVSGGGSQTHRALWSGRPTAYK